MKAIRFQEIFRNNTAFGGRVYRVMSNGSQARIESSDAGRPWIVRKTLPFVAFERWSNEVRLEDPYDQNPAKLDRLVND